MKIKKRAIIVFLLVIFVIFTYLNPLVFAETDPDYQYIAGQENSPGNQQQGSPNTDNPMGSTGGNQNKGDNPNDPNQQGNDNTNPTNGKQYRYRYQKRYTIMDGAENYTRIRSRYQDNDAEESFEIYFNIDNTPTFQLSFLPDLNATTSQHYFSIIIEQLIEYNDINDNGKYDSNDGIASSMPMSNVTFTNITYTNNTTPEGKTYTIIETHTTDNLFTIIIYLVSEKTSFLNNTITNKEIKIDFKIINYPFESQTSSLALITQIKTPFSINPEQNTYDEQQNTATQESGLNISSKDHVGFFSWANNVDVDNKTFPVNVTVISESEQIFSGDKQEAYTQNQVIFSYPRGESIIHDPKIGVISLLENVIPSILQLEYLTTIYLLACLFSGIVFYGIIYYKKNR